MPPGGTSCTESPRLHQTHGWLQYQADVADSNTQSTPRSKGMSEGGQEPLLAH